MKSWKLLTQLVPAVALLLLSAFGLQNSAPVFPAITAAEAVQTQVAEQTALPQREKEEEAETEELSQEEPGTGDYEDGTYYGTGTGFRGAVKVQVTVKNRQITNISVLSHQDDASFFNRAKALISSILTRQTWQVDSVSGATYSSRGIKEAVQNALTGSTSQSTPQAETAMAATPQTLSVMPYSAPEGGYRDGTYYGTGTGFGGSIKVKVVIRNGKIASISVVSAPKETGSYLKKAKGIIQRILSKQSPNVDTVSGATYSSSGIREGVKMALKQAGGKVKTDGTTKKSETNTKTPAVTGKTLSGSYRDGTYIGTGAGYGGEIQVQVTIKDNAITDLKIIQAKEETPSFLAKAEGVLPVVLEQQTTEVDVVAGATYSSRGILNAVVDALSQADSSGTAKPEEDAEEPEHPEESVEPEEPEIPSEDENGRNGTYTGKGSVQPDSAGEFSAYTLKIRVKFQNGKVVSIDNLTLEDADEWEWDTNEELSNYAANGRTLGGVKYPGVFEQLLQKQSTSGIDAVAGATCSSLGIVDAYEDACRQADAEQEATG
ncbi:MAG: FMN-binding protein [Candidatus Onthomonas sp.]|nr:FMN-binding protein [Candidatus Onthomonas sp.]